jgi:hypothetical protein
VNVITVENFDKCDDPVKTEEHIFHLLKKTNLNDYSNIFLVELPIAWNINKKGVLYCQSIIDSVVKNNSEKQLAFVCQHILVDKLNFRGHVVFTTHATYLNNYHSIPHFSVNCENSDVVDFDDRKYLLSFQGSLKTHSVRIELKNVLKERSDCFFVDTGNWHFENQQSIIENNSETYRELFRNTKISLCPRGTGPSTIRFWEALSFGCVPMVFSDVWKLPLDMFVDWDSFVINVPEKEVKNIDQYIPSDDELKNMSHVGNEIYKTYFSNENLHISILKTLEIF